MRVRYTDQDCDEEYEVCWEDEDGHSTLYDTESEAMEFIRLFEYPGGPVAHLYLLTTYYDAFGDRGLTESKLLYRTGEEIDE